MLPKQENELLTRTRPGTPMGELIRRYWIPALLSEEIPEPDCPPVQVRLLGEELVAFRDSKGKIGLLEEHCSHRGTSLFYGRNEDCGLRCIYHGWKYDVEGKVLETPAEPQGSDFKSKIQHTAYPTKEIGGIVFAYMGPKDKMPLFPNYEWTRVPLSHTYVTKCMLECNYLQGLEGECDKAHLSFLHITFDSKTEGDPAKECTVPVYETEKTDFGVRLVVLRKMASGETYVTLNNFVMPVSGWLPHNNEVHFYVPIDDEHSWRYDLGFTRGRPVEKGRLHRGKQIGPDYRRIRNPSNQYLQDREVQRRADFTGIEDFLNEDSCATESMGAIYDRSSEHLGASDEGIIAVRRFLLDAVKSLHHGLEPPHVIMDAAKNDFPQIVTSSKLVPPGQDWRDHFPNLA